MSITPDRWGQIEMLFHRALERPESERREFVRAEAANDRSLAGRVLSMLHADALEAGPIDASIVRRVGRPLAEDLVPGPGAMLGAWRILEVLGEGGMGTVFRAERSDGAYEQEAALKVLRLAVDDRAILRFAEERQMLARLSHPGIARLVDGGATPSGVPFLVMELVCGESIDEFVERRDLDTRSRVRLVLEVGEAVDHAHQNLIVHGDIKPENVLVDSAGRPRLVDFGVSRVLAGGEQEHEDRAYLTLEYASPERVLGGALATSADVYSVGVLLDRLLDLRGGSARSKDLAAVVKKARHRDPGQRYESMSALCEDLRRVIERRPVAARPHGFASHVACFARRNSLAASLAAAAAVTLVAGTVISLRFASVARKERDSARTAQHTAAQERDHAAIEAESARLASAFLTETLLVSRMLDDAERERLRLASLEQAARVRRQFAEQPHVRGNLLASVAETLSQVGCDQESESVVREVLALRIEEFGEASLEVALSLQSLGELMYARGEFRDALVEFEKALALHRSEPGAVHADVATAANNVAACLRALGRREEARRHHEEALFLRLRGGRESLPVAETLNNLGVLALDGADPARAKELLTEALAIRTKILGADAPLSLQSAMNLASARWGVGETRSAVDVLRVAADALREKRGAGDAHLLNVLTNLAGMELMQGENELALATATEAQQVLHRLGLRESRAALRVLRVLARVHKDAGRYGEAAAQHRDALELLQRVGPANVAAGLEHRVDLASCLVAARDFAAAAPILRRLYRMPEDVMGAERSLVAFLLAVCESRDGRRERARELVAAVIHDLERRLGHQHDFVRRAHEMLKNK